MIIPIRCFSCGKLIGDKYYTYHKRVRDKKLALNLDENNPSIVDTNIEDIKKTPEGEVLDELGLTRYCCRKILLGHVELINEI